MTQELMERTVRDWVHSNPARGARNLSRFGEPVPANDGLSADDIAEALIRVAGRMQLAQSRAW